MKGSAGLSQLKSCPPTARHCCLRQRVQAKAAGDDSGRRDVFRSKKDKDAEVGPILLHRQINLGQISADDITIHLAE